MCTCGSLPTFWCLQESPAEDVMKFPGKKGTQEAWRVQTMRQMICGRKEGHPQAHFGLFGNKISKTKTLHLTHENFSNFSPPFQNLQMQLLFSFKKISTALAPKKLNKYCVHILTF